MKAQFMMKQVVVAILAVVFLSACPVAGPKIKTVELESGLKAQVLAVKARGLNLEARQSSHLLFYEDTDMKIYYARVNDTHWGLQKNWALGTFGYGASHDLTLDKNENVHFSSSISDGYDEDLGYVNNVTGLWITAKPDALSGSSVGMYSKIAVDHQGNVHIIHWRWNDGAMLYTTNIGLFWQTKEMPITGTAQAIIIDSQNCVHVFAGSNHLVKVDGKWQIEEMPLSGYDLSVAIDGNDNLDLLTNQGLWRRSSDGVWQDREDIFDQMVDDSVYGSIGVSDNALAIDRQGNLHVAFSVLEYLGNDAGYKCQLYHGSNQSGDWQSFLVDRYQGTDYFYDEEPLLAVNADNDICFAYLVGGQIYFLTF